MNKRLFSYEFYFSILIVVIACFILLRSYYPFFYPVLHCEDGVLIYLSYFENNAAFNVYDVYSGYISLLPRLLGYIAMQFPPTISPNIISAFTLLINCFAYSLFYLKRFRFLVENDQHRFIICLIIAAFPLGNFALSSSLIYSSWYLLWIACLLIYAPFFSKEKKTLQISDFIIFSIIVLCVWSHPLSIFLAPLCVYRLIVSPSWKERYLQFFILITIFLYFKLGVVPTEVPTNLNHWLTLQRWRNGITYTLGRVIFEGLFGNSARYYFYSTLQAPIVYVSSLSFILGFLLLIKAHFSIIQKVDIRRIFIIFLIIFGLTLFMIISRDGRPFVGEWENRYFLLQKMMLLLSIGVITSRIFSSIKFSTVSQFSLSILLVLYLLVINQFNVKYYATSREAFNELQPLIERVSQQQTLFRTDSSYKHQFIFDWIALYQQRGCLQKK